MIINMTRRFTFTNIYQQQEKKERNKEKTTILDILV